MALQFEIVTPGKTHGPFTKEEVPDWIRTLGLKDEDEGENGWNVQVVGGFQEQVRVN